jgi:hypothetical protein
MTEITKKNKARVNGPWVEAISWSPDGKRVAMGTHGGLSKVEIAEISD